MTRLALVLRGWRFRPGATLLLLVLDALIVGACAVSPLYSRSVEQSTVLSTLTSASRVDRGASVSGDAGLDASAARRRLADPGLFGSVVGQIDVSAGLAVPGRSLVGSLVARDAQCAHLVMAAGSCPVGGNGVAMSSSLAAVIHARVGSKLSLSVPASGSGTRFEITVLVVGLYRPFSSDNDYWFNGHYSTRAGFTVEPDSVTADALFASRALVTGAARQLAAGSADAVAQYTVSVPVLAGRVRLSDVPALRRTVAALSAEHGATVQTALPELLAQVTSGQHSARDVIVPLAVALAVLALLVEVVVIGAAADARRPQTGLSRLRGNNRRAVATAFVVDLGALAVIAAVPGVLLAWAASALACHVWLPAGVTPELRWPVFAAAGAGAAAVLVVAAVVGFRSAGQPITALLRRAPLRVSHRGASVGEAMLVVAAAGGLVATLSGGSGDVLSLFTVPLLAALIGALAGRLLMAGARASGARVLARGAAVAAFALFGIGRRPGLRLVVAGVSVAVALAVFAGQQWASGAVNRHQRALAVDGAAVVLTVDASDVNVLRGAVAAADPSRRWATPVVVVIPPGIEAEPTIGVDPTSFAHIASWGRSALAPTEQQLKSTETVGRATTIPALLAGPSPDTLTPGGQLQIATIAGRVAAAHVIGRISFVPGVGASGVLTDLSTLVRRSGPTLDPTAHLQVWMRTEDRRRGSALEQTLRAHGVSVIERQTAASVQSSYEKSGPGWSALFALVVGLFALVLATLLVLLSSTARRERATDLAALRSMGLRSAQLRAATALELGVVAAVATACGIAGGLLGARLALPGVPLFVQHADIPLPVLHTLNWPWLLAAALAALVLLGLAVSILAARLARVAPSAAWTETT